MTCSVRAIVITDVFPPVSAVGVHRTVALCRRLVERGWGVTVVTARPGASAVLDEGLLEGVPKEVRVVRTTAPDILGLAVRIFRPRFGRVDSSKRAGDAGQTGEAENLQPGIFRRMVDWLSWWLHVPDGSVGWLVPAVWVGLREAGRHRPDVIYSSAPMWTSHLAAGALSRLLHVPWVADFRDPWCGSHWRKIPYRLHRKADDVLERLVIRRASRITCAWDGIRKHLVSRYPMKTKDITTIHNGFDPDQIGPISPVSLDESRCVLIHAGTLYGPRSPIPLLEGLRRFRREFPTEADRMLVVFLGLPEYNGRPLEDIVSGYGVGDLVRIIPPTSHKEALSFLKGADVAVLFGQGGDAALAPVPAKVYEYIGANKAVLAIGAGEEAVDIMRRGGCRLWCAEVGTESVAKSLADILMEFGRCSLRRQTDPNARDAFTRVRMADRLEEVLGEAIDAHRRT